MPELPEVEAARRLMHSYSLGGTIQKAFVDNDVKVIDGVTASALQEALIGKKIVAAHRKGKHMWLELNSGPHISFQFGMSGAIIVKGVKGPLYRNFKVSDENEFPTSYSKVHLVLDSGTEVAFIDKRRFARVRLLDNPTKVVPISELGPDAYLELPSAKEMVEALKAKKQAVKALLLDQGYIAGIGNWVADEVLYQSKIHPEQPANSLKEEEVIRLHNVIKEVLEKAVAVDADSEQFPQNWLFHHRWGKGKAAATMLDGNQVQHIDVANRSSAFVPAVQKYSGPELKGAKTRLAAEENPAPLEDDDEVEAEVAVETPKRGRGRPAKVKTDGAAGATSNDSPGSAKKRGRPPKQKTTGTSEEKKEEAAKEQASPSTEPKKRGRPPKAKTDAAASKSEPAAPKTEAAAASKEAVNKALEEAAPEEEAEAGSPVTPKRRGRPPKTKTGEDAPKLKIEEPAKAKAAEEPSSEETENVSKKAKVSEEGASVPVAAEQPKKGRGRPAKPKPEPSEATASFAPPAEAAAAAATSTPTPKKRGRPPTKQQA